jgi:phosphoribosylpyrophosphate synthetase
MRGTLNLVSEQAMVHFDNRDVHDQAKLAGISLECEDVNIRRDAVQRLTDQAMLAKIAVNSSDWFVRRTAVERLTDQAMLVEVTRESDDEYARRDALEKIADQVLLTKIASDSKDEYVRRTAVEKLTNQAQLAKFAIESADADVRRAAVKKLNDKAMLTKVASDSNHEFTRYQAEEKLAEQALLARIAIDAENEYAHRAVVEKVTDQTQLAIFANEAENEYTRHAAVEKLADQAMLAKVTIEGKDEYVRRTAVEKITDQAMLAKVVLEAKDADARLYAVEKSSDQVQLAMFAIEAKNPDTCRAAVKKLTNQAMLAKVVLEAKEVDARRDAVWKLTDKAQLAKVSNEVETAKGHNQSVSSELKALTWLASFARDRGISFRKLCGAFDDDTVALGILLRAMKANRPVARNNLEWLIEYFPDAAKWFPERTGLRIESTQQLEIYRLGDINHTGTLRVAFCHKYVPRRLNLNDPNSDRLLDLKTTGNPTSIDYYANAIHGLLNEGALLCCAPSSSKDKWNPGLVQLIAKLEAVTSCDSKYQLIRRRIDTDKRSTGGDRSLETNLESMVCSIPQSATDRDVVVLDDIVTSGNTLCACAEILWQAGVGSVSGIVLGKTIDSR